MCVIIFAFALLTISGCLIPYLYTLYPEEYGFQTMLINVSISMMCLIILVVTGFTVVGTCFFCETTVKPIRKIF